MRMHRTAIAAVAALAGAGCAVVYAVTHRSLRRTIGKQKSAADRQIAALATTVKALQRRVAELSRLIAARMGETPTLEAAPEDARGETPDPLTPEMLAVVTAAAATYVGQEARARSVRLAPEKAPASPWTQQGRTIAQMSHNLRRRD